MELSHDDRPDIVCGPSFARPSKWMKQTLPAVPPDRAASSTQGGPASPGRDEAGFVVPSDDGPAVRGYGIGIAIGLGVYVERPQVHHAVYRVPSHCGDLEFAQRSMSDHDRTVPRDAIGYADGVFLARHRSWKWIQDSPVLPSLPNGGMEVSPRIGDGADDSLPVARNGDSPENTAGLGDHLHAARGGPAAGGGAGPPLFLGPGHHG